MANETVEIMRNCHAAPGRDLCATPWFRRRWFLTLQNYTPGDPTRGYLGYAYGRIGDRGTAEQIALDQTQFAFHQALVFAGMGDKERALEALTRMTELGPARLGRALSLPELALVRGDRG